MCCQYNFIWNQFMLMFFAFITQIKIITNSAMPSCSRCNVVFALYHNHHQYIIRIYNVDNILYYKYAILLESVDCSNDRE